ncbi:MAG: tRNA preQ1(34) S-adenosylmethionine ribosyltransferase-isomerase QueA [Pseudomonadota bacterium]
MDLAAFDFDLPPERIALRPADPRSSARLLVATPHGQTDARVIDLPRFLAPGDVLVVNDTRVIPARLAGERRRDTDDGSGIARIEATLAEPVPSADAAAAAAEGAWPARWRSLVRPVKRLRAGDVVRFAGGLAATVEQAPGEGLAPLVFDRAGPALERAIAAAGVMPLPPYIAARRAADARDAEDYQTVFARRPGSVAAPTAALHADGALLAALDRAGIERAALTLHVGPGTFLPVKTERIEAHTMHAERGTIPPETAARLSAARAEGRRLIAVGTTSLRLLETAAREDGSIAPFEGSTDIFIRPGHRFRGADGLMTNFHLPRSTLFMLVSALMGLERMQALYAHAIASDYRFYSYGDASLLLPGATATATATAGAGARAGARARARGR